MSHHVRKTKSACSWNYANGCMLKTVKHFGKMVDVPEYFCIYINSQCNLTFLHLFKS